MCNFPVLASSYVEVVTRVATVFRALITKLRKVIMKRLVLCLFVFLSAVPSLVRAQTWHYTGTMHTERRLHSCEVLPDGKVLAAGGSDQFGVALSSAEVYDPATEVWTLVSPMSIPRERHATVQTLDGKVYVIGGNKGTTNNNIESASIEVFDYSTQTWTHVADLKIPRQNHTATLLNDSRILITGGYSGDVLSECEIFDPSTGVVTAVASLNLARHDHSATLLGDGKVLVLGGRNGGSGSDYFNQSEVYDPVANTWTVIDQMHEGRISASVVRFSDNSILVAGGRNSPNSIASGAEMLMPSSMTWSDISPILLPCNWQAGIRLPDDRYMITGGYSGGDLSTNTVVISTPTCEWYDHGTQSWYYAPTMNLLRSEHGGVYMRQVINDGLPRDILLVTGGITHANTFTPTCEILDVTSEAIAYYKAHQPSTSGVDGAQTLDPLHVTYGSDGYAKAATIGLQTSDQIWLEVYNENGTRLQRTDEGTIAAGNHEFQFNTAGLAGGVYLFRVVPAHSAAIPSKFMVMH